MRTPICRLLSFQQSFWILFILIYGGCKNNQTNLPVSFSGSHGIIPLPKNIIFTTDSLTLNQNTIFLPNKNFPVSSLAAETALKKVLTTFTVAENIPASSTSLQLTQDRTLKDDSYQLYVKKSGIEIKAGNEAGAFWGIQSLNQYLWNITQGLKQNSFKIPGITITDEPNYKWRGFHLDVARHFFAKEYILKIIDWLAYYKFNKFQLHLSDDQGWRIESKQFPLLNAIGSWRVFDKYDSICIAKASANPDLKIDPRFIQVKNGVTNYGGYYTQQDIAEIIAYAKDHFIEIIRKSICRVISLLL